ncbi:MAG: alpha/beta fold hydrolase [Pirellulaceae bacterium]
MTEIVLFTTVAMLFATVVWQTLGLIIARKLLYSDHHQIASLQTPEQRGLDVTRLSIPVDGQHNLAAWLVAPRPHVSLGGACVVMVHGYSSGKDKLWDFPEDDDYQASTLEQGAVSLVEAGFHVAAIDLRNHGESDDNGPVTLGARESDDVLATLDYLQCRANYLGIDRDRIGLRGESMGAATCLIAGARDQHNRVCAIWSDSAFACASDAIVDFMRYKNIPAVFARPARFWLTILAGVSLSEASPIQFIDSITCPVFLTHSDGDTMLPMRHLETLATSSEWQEQPTTWQLQSHGHNRLWREPDYHQRQIEFFRTHLAASKLQPKAA